MTFEPLVKGLLTINVESDESESRVKWVGRSDERDPAEFLNPYLAKIVTRMTGRDVKLDFRQLEYMNSSTIKPIIRFVQALAGSATKVSVQYNPAQKWQSISFDALRTVFLPLKNVSVVG